MKKYDVIVIGGGHAGVEAAFAATRLKQKVLLLSQNVKRISFMSCNPSIGGLGKGHMVREIDALGGVMGQVADEACLQFKRLNSKKGPAVRGTRMQCDKKIYSRLIYQRILRTENLELREEEVKKLIIQKECCVGVLTQKAEKIFSKTVVIATGTFMEAVMHFGLKRISGGRDGDKSTQGLSQQLSDFGFKVTRLKTGTPPRLSKESIDWSCMEIQKGDKKFIPFSYKSKPYLRLPQIDCYLTYTNERTHKIIRDNLDQSPLFSGLIEGIGPRYCPSIEDKLVRFMDKKKHQTFLEQESLDTDSIYLQGMSTSLPENVQYEFLKTIKGLENVKILKPGYAVEYDFIEPTEIKQTLETRKIENLFLAGQVNGTSGYEEAASQGLIAGANAALKILNKPDLILRRDQAYIGVLIDDLVTKGTKEPYRMMTSRAEHRLVLREDNVLERLSLLGFKIGLVLEEDFKTAQNILLKREALKKEIQAYKIVPNEKNNKKLKELSTKPIKKPIFLDDLLRRDEIHCLDLELFGMNVNKDECIFGPVEIDIKYDGYIKRQKELIKQAVKMEQYKIPTDMNYEKIKGLSLEEIEKLSAKKPRTLGQIGRVSGVNPSAIQAVMIYLKKQERMQTFKNKT